MSEAKSSQETHALHNTLAWILSKCEGHVTTVELRNEAHITGRVIQVDGFMNVTLREAVFHDSHGRSRRFDMFCVQNRLIRFVQIPTSIDLRSLATGEVSSRGRGRGRGDVRVSGGRKKILAIRERRRQEDLKNALEFKRSQEQQKGNTEEDNAS